MIAMTLADLAQVVGGELADADPAAQVGAPAFLDSRNPEPGGIFAAFVGENVDGHDFAATAVEGGAAVVVGTRATGVPTVVVPDTRTALQDLAREVLDRLRRRHRDRDPAPTVIAVTGSQGKTTAKDMLSAVLGEGASTVATQKSFNNELGLPLTVLRATEETRYLVLEMGARGVGHLAELCEIAPPDISLVLNVGKAHLGEFGSQEQIARAKGELVEALRPEGGAVLNLDDPLVSAMAERTSAHLWTFGRHPDAVVRLGAVTLDDLGRASFDLTHAEDTEHVDLQLLGEHQAVNAAAVTAAALAAGRLLPDVAQALRSITRLSPWRMEVAERADGLALVNDAYNANPDSMVAALRTLARMGQRGDRRTVAVLGEMRELGSAADEEHRAVGEAADDLGIDVVLVVGHAARPAYDVLVERRGADGSVHHLETAEDALSWLGENVAGPDVVLVKASRAAQLEKVAHALLADGSGPEGPAEAGEGEETDR